MVCGHTIARVAALALIGLALGACAQNRADVLVNVGAAVPVNAQAKDYAALYVPYAMMATAAYAAEADLNRHHCPDVSLLGRPDPSGDAAYRSDVRGWIKYLNTRGWQCRFGIVGSLPCPPRAGGAAECTPVGGLQFHVWRRMEHGQCREAVIAFRGTEKNEIGDWVSNFRWLYRLAPKFDQYAQIQTHITQIVARIKQNGCPRAIFASAGHSLGGGLAQQAAYADESNSIRYVYAFDPSPVTGFFDVSAMVREKSSKGLGVDRAYESGEILALPRMIIENIYPPAPCGPRVRTVRFNLLTGFGIAQHSIANLTQRLQTVAREPGANARRVDDSVRARDCQGGPLMAITPPA
jgi:pimeloyl-ACP methyl ester carboxylesterase